MLEAYRGVADVLNGLSGSQEEYGYGHREDYWKKPSRLAAEAWAQFGRIQYKNDPEVLKLLQELFPNFCQYAMLALKELI